MLDYFTCKILKLANLEIVCQAIASKYIVRLSDTKKKLHSRHWAAIILYKIAESISQIAHIFSDQILQMQQFCFAQWVKIRSHVEKIPRIQIKLISI